MLYYITETTHHINKQNCRNLIDEQYFSLDISDKEINEIGKYFYDALIDRTRYTLDTGTADTSCDYLYTQIWYADECRTQQIAIFQHTASQLIQSIYADAAAMSPEIGPCVLVAQYFPKNKYTDVSMTRERVYQRTDGTYMHEVARYVHMEQTAEWEYTRQAIKKQAAREWCLTHLHDSTFQWFGDLQQWKQVTSNNN